MEAAVICDLCASLGLHDGNFLSNTDEAKRNHARLHFVQSKIIDDGITVGEILQRCFMGQRKTERPKSSLIECRRSLLDLCKSLVKQQSNRYTADCNMCGSGISTKNHQHLVNHASAHLEVKLFQGKHCERSMSSITCVLQHIRRDHNVAPTKEDFEDKTVEHFDEMTELVKRCFSKSYPRACGSQRQFIIKSNCRHRSAVHLCRSIFIRRSKPESIECNVCGAEVNLRWRSSMASSMYNHAAAHLEVKLFTCRHCDQSTSTNRTMVVHLKNMHQIIKGTIADFVDQSEKFHSKYMEMIERCFSADQVKLEVPSTKDKTKIKGEVTLRRFVTGSKLTVERHLFCNRSIRKVVDPDGKIKCSLCARRLIVQRSGRIISQSAFLHAEMHLQKPIYRCKVCALPLFTRQAMADHLRTKHALRFGKNHEFFGDEYHKEIMDTLSECFATTN